MFTFSRSLNFFTSPFWWPLSSLKKWKGLLNRYMKDFVYDLFVWYKKWITCFFHYLSTVLFFYFFYFFLISFSYSTQFESVLALFSPFILKSNGFRFQWRHNYERVSAYVLLLLLILLFLLLLLFKSFINWKHIASKQLNAKLNSVPSADIIINFTIRPVLSRVLIDFHVVWNFC